jgi:hypothetical protein
MRATPGSLLLAALAAVVATASGCNKDKQKPDETPKSEPTPVPSGLVFNDFLDQGGAAGLGVRDASVEGGLAGVVGSSAGGGDDQAGSAAGGEDKPKIIDPGSEPRAVRKYTFVANRVDKRLLTIDQSVMQSMPGQPPQPGQQITLKLALDLTPKTVKPSGATLEAKVTKVDVPGAPPQAAQMLGSMTGLSGTFDATPHGDVGEVSFAASPQMKNQLADTIVQGISQAAQLMLVPFPDVPIGAGAKWEVASGGSGRGEAGVKRFALKDVTADGGTVDVDVQIKVPRHAQQSPRGGPPMFVEVDGKGKYSYQVKFDRTAPKVDGEMTLNEKLEVADPRSGQKQQLLQTSKSKYVIEAAK